jgi:hypothetical protein
MPGPIGNKHWMFRIKTGAPRKFDSPDELREAFNDYFQHVEDNPLKEAVLQKIKAAGGAEKVKVYSLPKMRCMTIQGFCGFTGCGSSTLYEYEKRDGFQEIIAQAREIMYGQKIEGAAAGLLNPSIIARELGLVERVENTEVPYQPIFDAGSKKE